MFKHKVIPAAVFAAALVTGAHAGTSVSPVKEADTKESPFSGDIGVGLINQYSEKGLVLTNAFTEEGMGVAGGASLRYTTPWRFDVVSCYAAQSFDMDTRGLSDSARQQDLWLGLRKQFGSCAKSEVGWHMTKGGFPGFAAVLDSNFNEGNDLFEEIYSASEYDLEAMLGWKGVFIRTLSGHSFDQTNGHWMGGTLGYRHALRERLSAVLSVTGSYSKNYWVDGISGWDAVVLKLELPYQCNDCVRFVPFISTNWGAHNAQAMNKLLPSVATLDNETRNPVSYPALFENFAIITGVYATWSF